MRELVGNLRKTSSFIQLFIFISLSLYFFLIFWHLTKTESNLFQFTSQGRFFFLRMNMIQALIIILIVPFISATRINMEREKDTWDLLISTPLNLCSILWGKFLASILYVWLFLLSLIPIYGLCMTAGGVSPEEIYFIFGMITESAAIVTLIGITCSIHYEKISTAIFSTFFLAIGYFIVLPAFCGAWYMVLDALKYKPFPFFYGLPILSSPFVMVALFFEGNTGAPQEIVNPWCVQHPYISHAFITAILMFFMIVRAIRALSRMKKRRRFNVTSLTRRILLKKESRKGSSSFEEKQLYPDQRNPVCMKDLRSIYGPINFWFYFQMLLFFCVSTMLIGFHFHPSGDPKRFSFFLEWRMWIPFVMLWISPIFILPYAVETIRRECDRDTMSILITTAQTSKQIVWGKFTAGLSMFLWRFWAFYGLPLLVWFFTIYKSEYLSYKILHNSAEFIIGSCLLFILMGVLTISIGLFCSSFAKSIAAAYIQTLFLLYLCLFGFGFCFFFFGRPAVLLWEALANYISPIFLCFRYKEPLVRGVSPTIIGWLWWKLVIIQSGVLLGYSWVFYRLTVKRLQRFSNQ
jgi:ABC-type transport system involved in multi-copper enzyme maturation permease subunit